MGPKIWMPRLSPREVEELTLCLTRLDQIHDSLAATNIGGRLAVMQLTIEVYRAIERVLYKVRTAVEAAQRRGAGELAGQDAPKEG